MSITTQQFIISAWSTIVPIGAVLAGTTVLIQNIFAVRKLRNEIRRLQRESEGSRSPNNIPTAEELRQFSIRTQITIGVLVLIFVGLAAASFRVRESLRRTQGDFAQSVELAKQEGYRQAEVDAAEKERRRLLILREQIRRLEAENAALRKKAPQPSPTEPDAPETDVASAGTRF